MTDVIPEVSGEIPPLSRLEKVVQESQGDMIQKIKWQLAFSKRMREGTKAPFDPEELRDHIDGLLRADLSERLSVLLDFGECETVYSSPGFDASGLKVASFREITGHNSKEQVLTFAVEKSLNEAPPVALKNYLYRSIRDETERKVFYNEALREIVQGYSAQGSNGNVGIYFGETVIPDAALVNTEGEISGFVEVKAYFPGELEALVRHLRALRKEGKLVSPKAMIDVEQGGKVRNFNMGVDLDGEILFVDTIRRSGYGLEPLGADMPSVLRFPSDIPDAQLVLFGEVLTALHYPNVAIQKLPVSSAELSHMARQFVGTNFEKFKGKDTKFTYSDREIQVLKAYSQQPNPS